MVENGVTKGDKAKNPFNFKHFDLKEHEVRAAGCTFPNNSLPLDFDKGQYLAAWLDLMRTIYMESDGFASLIDYEDYPDGLNIIGVDLTGALPSDLTGVSSFMSVSFSELRLKSFLHPGVMLSNSISTKSSRSGRECS